MPATSHPLVRRAAAAATSILLLATLVGLQPASAQPQATTPRTCDLAAQVPDRVTCLHVPTPLDHSAPDGAAVQVAVTRIGSAGAVQSPPLLVVAPDADGLATGLVGPGPLSQLARGREVVVLQPRGSGASIPSVACPEVDAEPGGASDAADLQTLLDAVGACHDRLAQAGVDPQDHVATAAAGDLAVVRDALGLGTIDVLGTGTGTMVVEAAVRRGLADVHAVVLDSPVPLAANRLLGDGDGLARAFETLSLGCSDVACRDDLGPLDGELIAAVEALTAEPAVITVDGLIGQLTATDLVQAVHGLLADGRRAAEVPDLLVAAAGPDVDTLESIIQGAPALRPAAASGGIGQALTVRCAIDLPRTSEAQQAEASSGLPAVIAEAWLAGHPLSGDAVREACQRWPVGPVAVDDLGSLPAGTPMLALHGALDPGVAPAWAPDLVAEAGAGHAVTFPDQGAQPLLHDGDCAVSLVDAFLQAPSDAPSEACAKDPTPRGLSPLRRVAGTDRIGTAVAAARSAFGDGQAGGAVLVGPDRWFDAVVGAPLATALKGPLLLTPTSGLEPRVQAELARAVRAGRDVHLLGGPFDPSVIAAVHDLGLDPVVLTADDDVTLALAVVEELDDRRRLQRVFLADASTFADPLVASPLAASARGAVLPSDGDTLPDAVADFLASSGLPVIAVGGGAARAHPVDGVLAGATRYETSAIVARSAYVMPRTFGLASGADFPDAAAAGALLGPVGSPLLLTPPDAVHPEVRRLLGTAAGLDDLVVFGGPQAVAAHVAQGYVDAG